MTASGARLRRTDRNSLDSVSDRDFALDYLMAATQVRAASLAAGRGVHHLGEPALRLRVAARRLSTGSSIMPQKRNPDAAELVRGHAGRIMGCLTALAVTMKGLPLAYSKDMQDDKPPVFEAHDLLGLCIAAMTGMVETVTFRTERMRGIGGEGLPPRPTLPTGWCARRTFRSARRTTSPAARSSWRRKWACALDALPLADLQTIDARIDERHLFGAHGRCLGREPR
jgi:argininosuccinate lyase